VRVKSMRDAIIRFSFHGGDTGSSTRLARPLSLKGLPTNRNLILCCSQARFKERTLPFSSGSRQFGDSNSTERIGTISEPLVPGPLFLKITPYLDGTSIA
jgi:hypothetical protein